MAIYTRRGDQGRTNLYEGKRRWKNDRRVVALGAIDELNSQLGFVSSLLSRRTRKFKDIIHQVQQDLFEIASELAMPPPKKTRFLLGAKKIREIEGQIDYLEGELPVLANFIFPGGSPAGASLHVARSVCRRAEREVVALSREEKMNPNILVYLNRLSDLLFMLARKINRLHKTSEVQWKSR